MSVSAGIVLTESGGNDPAAKKRRNGQREGIPKGVRQNDILAKVEGTKDREFFKPLKLFVREIYLYLVELGRLHCYESITILYSD